MSDLETFCVGLFVVLGFWAAGKGMAEWWRKLPVSPDPWDAEITRELDSLEATPVCHHCFTPQEHDRWFCPVCGAATGPYNNMMPYLVIFSRGEVLRNGVYQHIRHSRFWLLGYCAYAIFEYGIFAPVYRWQFYNHWRKAPVEPLDQSDQLAQ